MSEQRRFVYRLAGDYGAVFTMSDGDPIPYHVRDEVLDWCRERFGPLVNRGLWEANSWAGSAHGPFIDIGIWRDDWAVEFRMRWC